MPGLLVAKLASWRPEFKLLVCCMCAACHRCARFNPRSLRQPVGLRANQPASQSVSPAVRLRAHLSVHH
jgi:hypothetical protein